jgi:hypothetical protein
MDGMTIFFMILILGFYIGGFIYFANKAALSEKKKKKS